MAERQSDTTNHAETSDTEDLNDQGNSVFNDAYEIPILPPPISRELAGAPNPFKIPDGIGKYKRLEE